MDKTMYVKILSVKSDGQLKKTKIGSKRIISVKRSLKTILN